MSPTARLDVLCTIQSGGTPRRDQAHFYGGEIPWAKISDLETVEGVVNSTEERITEDGLEAIGGRLVPPGTVLLAMYGSVGKTAVAGVSLSMNQAILGIQINAADRLDNRYLFHWLQSIQHQLLLSANGVTQKNISATAVRALRIPLPPLREQRRIAELLDRADAVRRKREESRRLVDELLRSVFLEMFGDHLARRPVGTQVALGELCDIQLGKMLSQRAKTGVGSVPYLRNANVQWRGFNLETVFEMDFSVRELQRFALRPGDLLVCEGGEVGRCAIWMGQLEVCAFQKALHRLRAKDGRLSMIFLREWLFHQAKRGALLDSTSQATIAHLTKERLERLPISLPSPDRQQAFAERVAEIEELGIHFEMASESVENLADTLSVEVLPAAQARQ